MTLIAPPVPASLAPAAHCETLADTATVHNELTTFLTASDAWTQYQPALALRMWEDMATRLDAHRAEVHAQECNLPHDVYTALVGFLNQALYLRGSVDRCLEYSLALAYSDRDNLAAADALIERAAQTAKLTVTPL